MKSQKDTFQKWQKLLAEKGWLLSAPSSVPREESSFCDFWKMTSCDFTLLHSFFTQANVKWLDVLGKEYYS